MSYERGFPGNRRPDAGQGRQAWLALALAGGLLLLLAACAGQPTVVRPTATPLPEPTGTPSPSVLPAPQGPITLTYWEEDSNEAVVLLDSLAGAFMQANPGIVIAREHYNYDDLRNQFRAAALGGKGPTLVRAPGEFAGPFGELGIVRALDEFYSAEYLDQFLRGALEGATAKGKLWGLPDNFGNHVLLLYNRALVTDVPSNTGAWIQQLKTLTDAVNGKYGLVYPAAESYWLIPWLSGYGGWPLDSQDHLALDTAEMIEALWFSHDLKYEHKVMPDNAAYEAGFDLFREGNAAYTIDGAWNLDRYRDLGLDVGVALLPRISSTGLHPAPMATGRYWFINSDLSGETLDVAARFVEFMVSADSQEQWLTQLRRLPSNQELARRDPGPDDPALAGILAQLRLARGMPPALEMTCAWQGLGASLPQVMNGTLSPDDAAPKMQADGEACIEDMGGYLLPTPAP